MLSPFSRLAPPRRMLAAGSLLLAATALSQPVAPDAAVPVLNAGGVVHSIWRDGDFVYIGGSFTTVGGTARSNLAAFNARTGVVLPWNPHVNGAVRTVQVEADRLYAGGDFNQVNGSPGPGSAVGRNRLAAFELAINSAAGSVDSSWNPNINNSVRALLVDGGRVYAGGAFTTVNGGATRNRLAAFRPANGSDAGTAEPWNPNVTGGSNSVDSIHAAGNRIYAGGSFSSVNGSPGPGTAVLRNNLAAFARANSGALGLTDTTWNPDVDGDVYCMKSAEGYLIFGGRFRYVNTTVNRNFLAAVDLADTGTTGGVNLTWNPDITIHTDGIRSLSFYDTKLLAAGDITFVNGAVARSNMALFPIPGRNRTAAVDPWNPVFNSSSLVNATWTENRAIYAGGDFSTIASVSKRGMAAFHATGADVSVSYSASNAAPALGQATQYTLQVTNSGPDEATGLTVQAALDPSMVVESASATAGTWTSPVWSIPGLSGFGSTVDTKYPETFVPPNSTSVHCMARDGNTIYVAGSFLTMGGYSRSMIAAFDAVTGAMDTAWNPNIGSGYEQVRSIAVYGRKVYVGGSFSTVNGGAVTRRAGAAFHIADGVDTGTVDLSWDPDATGTWSSPGYFPTFFTLTAYGDKIYVGGDFHTLKTTASPVSRNRLAALDPVTGAPDAAWNPNIGSVAMTGPMVYQVLPIAGHLYAYGGYNRVNGSTVRNRLSAFPLADGSNAGTVDPTWNPDVNQPGFGLAFAAGRLYVGGDFSTVNGGTARNSIAAFSPVGTTGALDTSWLPVLTSTMGSTHVQGLALAGGDIYLCGWFTSINGAPRRYLASIPLAGASYAGQPTAFEPPYLNAPPWYVTQFGQTLFVGGGFYKGGAAPRNNLFGINATSLKSATLTLNVAPTGSGVRASTAQLMSGPVPDPDSTPGNNAPGEDDQATANMTVGAPSAPATPDMTAATDTGSLSTDNRTRLAAPTFTGTGARFTTVTLSTVGGSQNQAVGTGLVASNGIWSITPSTPLEEANHALRATVTEYYGTVGPQSGALNAVVDLTSPTVASVNAVGQQTVDVAFSEPMAGAGVAAPGSYILSGTGQGTLAATPASAVLQSGSTWRLQWASGSQNFGGDVTVDVSGLVTDAAGNTLGSPDSRTHVGGGVPVSVSGFTLE